MHSLKHNFMAEFLKSLQNGVSYGNADRLLAAGTPAGSTIINGSEGDMIQAHR